MKNIPYVRTWLQMMITSMYMHGDDKCPGRTNQYYETIDNSYTVLQGNTQNGLSVAVGDGYKQTIPVQHQVILLLGGCLDRKLI